MQLRHEYSGLVSGFMCGAAELGCLQLTTPVYVCTEAVGAPRRNGSSRGQKTKHGLLSPLKVPVAVGIGMSLSLFLEASGLAARYGQKLPSTFVFLRIRAYIGGN